MLTPLNPNEIQLAQQRAQHYWLKHSQALSKPDKVSRSEHYEYFGRQYLSAIDQIRDDCQLF
jgi:hypothetical protein